MNTLTREQETLIRQTITSDFTQLEHDMFITACNRTGLDPFTNQIYAVGRYDRTAKRSVMSIQPSIDAYRLAAGRTREYAGQVGPLYLTREGEWVDTWLENYPPRAAKVGVLRRGFTQPVWAVARWESYVQQYQGKPSGQWARIPEVMLANAAERLALRRAGFAHDIAALGEDESALEEAGEMYTQPDPPADDPPAAPTPIPTPKPSKPPQPAAAAPPTPKEDAPAESTEAKTVDKGQIVRINRPFSQLGLDAKTDRDLKLTYLSRALGLELKSSKEIPSARFKDAVQAVDLLAESLSDYNPEQIRGFLQHAFDQGLTLEDGGRILSEIKSYQAELAKAADASPDSDSEAPGDWLDQNIPDDGKAPTKAEEKPEKETKRKNGKAGDTKAMPPISEDEAMSYDDLSV